MVKVTSRNILMLGYACLGFVYSVATINNVLINLTGNRTIGAGLIAVFSIVMLIGLAKFPRIFSVISSLCFAVGLVITAYLVVLVWPNVLWFWAGLVALGLFGLTVSVLSVKSENGL